MTTVRPGRAVAHLQLLGGAAIEDAHLTEGAASGRRRSLALLALVAAAAPLPLAREKLLAHLWPESDAGRARNSLRQMLFWLRRELGEDLFLPESAGGLQLNPDRVSVDLWTFRDSLAAGSLAAAVDAYGGPFLDGFHVSGLGEFARWAEVERDALQRDHLGALEVLAQQAEAAHSYHEAVQWRRRLAAADPCSSPVALALLRALVAADDRPGALQFAAVHQAVVREQLETEPDPAVVAYVDSLRYASVPGTAPMNADTHVSPESAQSRDVALHATSVAQPAAGSSAVVAGQRSSWRMPGRRVWLTLAALILVGAATSASILAIRVGSDAPAVLVLGSGVRVEGGRDVDTRLVACDGPACPPGELPQAAFVVPKHKFHGGATAGTRFVAPVPDGTTRPGTGYTCCSTAVFEHTFALPPEALSATISLSVLADNHATVMMNGVSFGRHAEPYEASNYAGPRTTFSASFVPAPDGDNTLRIVLWNGGGAAALHYSGIVTWVSVVDTDGDGVPDDSDAFPDSDVRPTVHVGRCPTTVHNLTRDTPPGATLNDLIADAVADERRDEVDARIVALATEWQNSGHLAERDVGLIAACATAW